MIWQFMQAPMFSLCFHSCIYLFVLFNLYGWRGNRVNTLWKPMTIHGLLEEHPLYGWRGKCIEHRVNARSVHTNMIQYICMILFHSSSPWNQVKDWISIVNWKSWYKWLRCNLIENACTDILPKGVIIIY